MTIRITSSRPTALCRLTLGALFVAFALVGCGGGGSSDSSNPQPEPLPPPIVPDPPPAPPPAASRGSVSLLAGTTAGFGNLDGTGSAARFNSPGGVALDAAGNLYVADPGGHKVRKVTPAGVVSTVAGTGVAGYGDGASNVATFCGPTDVAVDGNNNVFVLDNVVLRKISADGHVTTLTKEVLANCDISRLAAEPKFPRALTVTQSGVLYIANQIPTEVYRLAPTGELVRLEGIDQPTADGVGAFGQLFDIAVDDVGNLYVAGSVGLGPAAIRKITPTGAIRTVFVAPADSRGPLVLTVDRNGTLYFAAEGTIQTVLPNGAVQRVATDVVTRAIAVDANGSIWLNDFTNTIRRIDTAGNVVDVAGQREPTGPTFEGRQAANRAGNVYVLAQQPLSSSLLPQRIAPDGQITTLIEGLRRPQGMAVDGEDNVYLTSEIQIGTTCFRGDCNVPIYGTEITKIDSQGRATKLPRFYRDAAGNEIDLKAISALTAERTGNLYVANGASVFIETPITTIYRITPAGAITTVGAGPVRLSDLAADSGGNVYAGVCGLANVPSGAQIVRYGVDGTAVALAGSPIAGAADGTGEQARFGSCDVGLGIDRNDRLFVADPKNHAVRRVSADGRVSTVVGRLGVQGITLGELPASLSEPLDVSFDGEGNMYVSSVHAVLKVQLAD